MKEQTLPPYLLTFLNDLKLKVVDGYLNCQNKECHKLITVNQMSVFVDADLTPKALCLDCIKKQADKHNISLKG